MVGVLSVAPVKSHNAPPQFFGLLGQHYLDTDISSDLVSHMLASWTTKQPAKEL